MFQEVRGDLGDITIGGLAQHLRDNGETYGVDDFIHRVLWHGHATGMWDRVGDMWVEKN